MFCPKCGKENPEHAQACSACNSALTKPTARPEREDVRTSGLAIAAFLSAMLAPFVFLLGPIFESVIFVCVCIVALLLALALGIISLIQIGLSGGRLAGEGLATVGIVIPVVAFAFTAGIGMPLFLKTRSLTFRMTCGTNLSDISKAMYFYAND